jgi:hypothetical protein
MYKFFKIAAVCLMMFTSACSEEDKVSQENTGNALSATVYSQGTNEVRSVFNIEIADTPEKIYHGLMGRTVLDAKSGMLFDINLIARDIDIAFWMKDTLIPLDILFIDENGVIFHIHKNAKPYDTTPIYPPKRPRAVLEINGGQSDEFGIEVGDMLKADLLGNN